MAEGVAARAAAAEILGGILGEGRMLEDVSAPDLTPADRARALRLAATVLRHLEPADRALDEARAFWALEPDPMLPAAKALGLPQFRRHLNGEIDLSDAIDDAKLQTRRFAKRQSTWFRNQTADWARLPAGDPNALAATIQAALHEP